MTAGRSSGRREEGEDGSIGSTGELGKRKPFLEAHTSSSVDELQAISTLTKTCCSAGETAILLGSV
jgi:hypothetical protein